ncbi:hypothetical protein BJ165DRAFT_1521324 [Panaeolus papilionaceus]|nr:hypothetical protein BJ165DRAFT_1521324 [Panaeolus papilionaceus]
MVALHILIFLHPSYSDMCYWRRVRNIYKKCGHGVTLPDEEIKCDLVNCKFSPAHPNDCNPPQCTQSCWQYRQFPQQYSPHIDKACPQCSGHK